MEHIVTVINRDSKLLTFYILFKENTFTRMKSDDSPPMSAMINIKILPH